MLKKIRTQEEIERRRRKNQLIVGGILIVLMVLSTAGFSIMSRENKSSGIVKYKDYKFIRQGGFWKLAIGKNVFAFSFLPKEVENVSIKGFYDLNQYAGQPIYFVGESDAVPEIINNLGRYVLRYQSACLNDSTEMSSLNSTKCNGELPIKDCDSNLIIFKEGDSDKVYQDKKCVYILGNHKKGADKFLYNLLKIE